MPGPQAGPAPAAERDLGAHDAGTNGEVRTAVASAPQDGDAATAPRGTVRITVYRWPMVPQHGVQVRVPPEEGSTDARGEVTLSAAPGLHRVVLGKLPDGLLPPIASWTRDVGEDPDGYFSSHVLVEPETLTTHVVRVFASGSLQGMVLDARRQPVAARNVTLYGVRGVLRHWHATAITDTQGLFTFAAVRAGVYAVAVAPEPGSVCPLPERFELAEGEHRLLPPLRVDAGDRAVRAVVRDERGAPLPGLVVTVYPAGQGPEAAGQRGRRRDALAEGNTDADGVFFVSSLPAARLLVEVRAASGKNTTALREPVTPREVDVTRELSRDVVVVAHPARPFSLTVLLRSNEAAVRARHPQLLEVAPSRVFVACQSRLDLPSAWQELRLQGGTAGEWTCTWSCPTPHETVWVVATRPGFPDGRLRVEPIEDGEQTVRLQHP